MNPGEPTTREKFELAALMLSDIMLQVFPDAWRTQSRLPPS